MTFTQRIKNAIDEHNHGFDLIEIDHITLETTGFRFTTVEITEELITYLDKITMSKGHPNTIVCAEIGLPNGVTLTFYMGQHEPDISNFPEHRYDDSPIEELKKFTTNNATTALN